LEILLRPEYSLQDHSISLGVATSGEHKGCFVACSRYSTDHLPDWFLIEYSGPKCDAALRDEISFDNSQDLEEFCEKENIQWLDPEEMQEELRAWFPTHFRRASALERFFEWLWNGKKA